MKKWSLILGTIALSFVTIFVTKRSKSVNNAVLLNTSEAAVQRHLIDKKNWPKWWPGEQRNDSTFSFMEVNYVYQKPLINGCELRLESGIQKSLGSLAFVALNDTTIQLQWVAYKGAEPTSSMKESMQSLLVQAQQFFSLQEKLYGFKVGVTRVPNPHLISTKKAFAQYPTVAEVYAMIDQLQQHAKAKNVKQVNSPMLHVNKAEYGTGFEAMVAIPIESKLEESGTIKPKFMIQGALLETEIMGGTYKVEQCINEMKNYLQDNKLSSPAIPYQSLISDRRIADSSKWVTKIYYPVFKQVGF